jgi:hypothetical protein
LPWMRGNVKYGIIAIAIRFSLRKAGQLPSNRDRLAAI